jgi:hypothetical protein
LQGTGIRVCQDCARWYYFALPKAGTIVATVDYSFSDSDLWLYLAPGHCTYEMSEAHQCSWTISSSPGQKPMKISMTLEAGEYTFVIANYGNHDETVSFQVVFTPSASAAGLAHGAAHESAPPTQLVPHGPPGPQSTLR